MGRKNKIFQKAEILKAIAESNGLVVRVAKKLNCDWHTAENNINRTEETKRAFLDEKEAFIDLAESKAMELIESGDGAMIRYYLSTIGKKRGYTQQIEYAELTKKNDIPDNPEERKAIAEKIRRELGLRKE